MYPFDQFIDVARASFDLGGRMAAGALADGMRLRTQPPFAGPWQGVLDSAQQWSRLSDNSRACFTRMTLESLQSAGTMLTAALDAEPRPAGGRAGHAGGSSAAFAEAGMASGVTRPRKGGRP